MIWRLMKSGDRLVKAVGYVGLILFPVLILCTVYEVIARYLFNAPTIWAFDITFMTHGALFMLTAAYALQRNAHVRIDVLSTRLPNRVQHAANLFSYVFLLLPGLWIFTNAALARSYSAYVGDEVELVSSWGPYVWPFFAVLTLGLAALWLQCLIETVRHVIRFFKGEPLMPPDSGTSS